MKSTQLEILLFTDTRFSSRQFCEKYDIDNQNNSAEYKKLQAACWNGLFQEVLPEIYKNARNRKKLILWKVTHAEHFLDLEYGEQPQGKEKFFSMNPYFFLGTQLLS